MPIKETEPLPAPGAPRGLLARPLPPRIHVAVSAGPDIGKGLLLDGTAFVGTHPEAELVLTDTTVSRHHLELSASPEGVRVRDHGSRNGTYVAGTRITEVVLKPPATVTLGKTVLVLSAESEELGDALPEAFGELVGRAPGMRQVFSGLARAAPQDTPLLIEGETGTGKELAARSVHAARGKGGPFVVVDCAALAPELVESELFGHVKGAFSGATADRLGAFASAEGGTLLLDAVDELPLSLQPRFLRVLESGAVRRVGEDREREVRFRLVAATRLGLLEQCARGKFREDLFYRISVLHCVLPPLRERTEDIPLLMRHFLARQGRPDFEPSPALMNALEGYDWPGNVRELRNVVERSLQGLALPPRPETAIPSLPTADLISLPFQEAKEALLGRFAREYFGELLRRCDGNVSELARVAGLSRTQVYALKHRYGL